MIYLKHQCWAAWKNGQDLSIHGWVYGFGFVTDLKSISVQIKELDEVYQLNL
jgi:carbonic anhydrase